MSIYFALFIPQKTLIPANIPDKWWKVSLHLNWSHCTPLIFDLKSEQKKLNGIDEIIRVENWNWNKEILKELAQAMESSWIQQYCFDLIRMQIFTFLVLLKQKWKSVFTVPTNIGSGSRFSPIPTQRGEFYFIVTVDHHD